jgi:hypothetical protein
MMFNIKKHSIFFFILLVIFINRYMLVLKVISEQIKFEVSESFHWRKTKYRRLYILSFPFLFFSISGRFMNASGQTNLHTLWDTGIITYRMRADFHSDPDLYYEYIYQLMIRQMVTPNDNDIKQWIQESLNIVCEHVYFDEKNETMNTSIRFTLKDVYYRSSYAIIEQRLAQGGRRLGALLNRLAENPPKRSTRHSLCLSTYILIAVLAAELILGICLGIYFLIRSKSKH